MTDHSAQHDPAQAQQTHSQKFLRQLEEALLNNYQRNFPLVPEPFAQIAKIHKTSTAVILKQLKSLKIAGKISRLGPVFCPNTIGVSTLAAMQVPQNRLQEVADLVNQYPEVNHNYERDHSYNLWFVATAPNHQHLEETIQKIEKSSSLDVMRLPLLREFHIDLGFNLSSKPLQHSANFSCKPQKAKKQMPDAVQQRLIADIQTGLELTPQPYASIARKLGISEAAVLSQIQSMLDQGIIRRLGVIVHHRELGYRANAMVVWDFPDEQLLQLGNILSQIDCVTLCYQRPRHLPHWRYNLFTMIHGKDKASVEQRIEEITRQLDLTEIPKAILFSKRRFKQKGACYRYPQTAMDYQLASNE